MGWLSDMTSEEFAAEKERQKRADFTGAKTSEQDFDEAFRIISEREQKQDADARAELKARKDFTIDLAKSKADLASEQEKANKAYTEAGDFASALKAKALQAPSTASLESALTKRALGETPSLAAAQMKATSDKNLAQQLAAASAARGGNQAALQRTLARNQAMSGQDLVQQSGIASMQEQAQNAGLALQAAQTGTAQTSAATSAALQAQQAQTQIAQLQQQYIAQGMSAAQAEQQAAADYAKLKQQEALTKEQFKTQIEQANISGQYGLQSTKAGSLIGQAAGLFGIGSGSIFKDGGVVGKKIKIEDTLKAKYAEGGSIQPIPPLQKPTISERLANIGSNLAMSELSKDKGLQDFAKAKSIYSSVSDLIGSMSDKVPSTEGTGLEVLDDVQKATTDANPQNVVKAIASLYSTISGNPNPSAAADGGIMPLSKKLNKKATSYKDVLQVRRNSKN